MKIRVLKIIYIASVPAPRRVTRTPLKKNIYPSASKKNVDMLTLNLGCGESKKGDIRLDIRKTSAVNIIADAHHLPFRNEVFDRVFCIEVLEHLNSPLKALNEIRRVLNKNGTIIVTVPNLTEIRRIISIIRRPSRARCTKTDHKQGWDAIEFHRLAYQAGLKIIHIDWLDVYKRKKRKKLDPLLKYILPRTLFYKHMKILLKKRC